MLCDYDYESVINGVQGENLGEFKPKGSRYSVLNSVVCTVI